MHIDNLVQYDEYKMPKDSHFEDNMEANDWCWYVDCQKFSIDFQIKSSIVVQTSKFN